MGRRRLFDKLLAFLTWRLASQLWAGLHRQVQTERRISPSSLFRRPPPDHQESGPRRERPQDPNFLWQSRPIRIAVGELDCWTRARQYVLRTAEWHGEVQWASP